MRSSSTCLMVCSTLLLWPLLAPCFCPRATGAAVRTRTAITSVRLMESSPSNNWQAIPQRHPALAPPPNPRPPRGGAGMLHRTLCLYHDLLGATYSVNTNSRTRDSPHTRQQQGVENAGRGLFMTQPVPVSIVAPP